MPTPSLATFPSGLLFPGVTGISGSLVWDKPNERYYRTGVDRGVLYLGNVAVPWNGIIGVDETGVMASTVLYRDGNIFYVDAEPGDFQGTVKAFFWPDEFSEALGMPEVAPGLKIDHQKPKFFGLSYRSLIGNGNTGNMFGYEIHLVYNALASIGSRSRTTKSDTPHMEEYTFDLTAVPVSVPGFRPAAHFILDTRTLEDGMLEVLESILYGNETNPPELPDPVLLYDFLNFGSSITFVDHEDGTWTATGSSSNLVDNGDGTWEILNVNGVDHGDGTYTLSDTP